MFSGFYTIASGMMNNQKELNVAANNLANVRTSGYRSKRLIKTTFDETFVRQMNGQSIEVGGGSTINLATDEVTSHRQGELKDTGKSYDLAISGEGFFVIQGEAGTYLTRNGHFSTDEEGNLILPGVGTVMGDGGPVYVDENGFYVGQDGIVYDSEGGELDQIQIMNPDNVEDLTLNENGTYSVGEGVNMEQVYPNIYQGKLENSGVDLNSEVTRTMEIQRAFQSCAKALTIMDQMNQKTASEVGKI